MVSTEMFIVSVPESSARDEWMLTRLGSKYIQDYLLFESLSTFCHIVTNGHLELQTMGFVKKTNKKRHERLCIVNRSLMGDVLTSIHRKTERKIMTTTVAECSML